MHNIAQALRDDFCGSSFRQNKVLREQHAGDDRERGGDESRQHIQPYDRAETAIQFGRSLRQSAGNDDKDQNWGNAFQRTNKQVAEFFQPDGSRANQCQHGTDHQTDSDTQDQAGIVVLFCNRFEC